MSLVSILGVFSVLLLSVSESGAAIVHIPTSKAISLARMVARNEGYDVGNDKVYSFELLTTADGKPLLPGYTSIGFYINGNIRSSISINETTGQAIDMNSCEIFDFPDMRPFQKEMMQLSKAKRKTPQELANDAGCSSPMVLRKPAARRQASRRQ